MYDGLDGVVQSTIMGKDQDLLGLPQAIVNANKQLEQAKKPYLAGRPSCFFSRELPSVPRRHETAWTPVDENVLKLRNFTIEPV